MTTPTGPQDPVGAPQSPLLVSVKLERFKASFRPDPVALLPFTVLIGRNGSGKSTLVEALQWLDVTLRRDVVEACKRYFGVHDLFNRVQRQNGGAPRRLSAACYEKTTTYARRARQSDREIRHFVTSCRTST